MARGTWTSVVSATALILALIPLAMPAGIVVSVCTTTDALQLHGAGQEWCGGCESCAPIEVAEVVHSCCSAEAEAAPEDSSAEKPRDANACACCVELTTFTGQDLESPKRVDDEIAPPATTIQPAFFDAAPEREDTPVAGAAAAPLDCGSFLIPLLN